MNSRIGRTFVQLAAVVFLLSTTTAYGLCCFSLAPDEAAAEVTIPCHQADGAEGAEPPGDCCLLCMPMLMQGGDSIVSVSEPVTVSVTNDASVRHSVDPPFRPPIRFLS